MLARIDAVKIPGMDGGQRRCRYEAVVELCLRRRRFDRRKDHSMTMKMIASTQPFDMMSHLLNPLRTGSAGALATNSTMILASETENSRRY